MFASIPITHFLWEGITAFLCFFLLKTLTNFPLAAGVVVVATATMTIWYLPGPAELNVELTLWQILATAIGALITFLVEVVFRSFSLSDPLRDGIEDRLRSIEDTLHAYGKGELVADGTAALLTQYAMTGVSMLRQQVARNHATATQRERMNAVVSLLGRGVDLAAALVSSHEALEPASGVHTESLAQRISAIRKTIRSGAPVMDAPEAQPAEDLPPLLSQLMVTVGLMEHVLIASHVTDRGLVVLDGAAAENHIFVNDAFTNPEYLKYALAGTAASMLCYVIYVALNWPGISTAVTTCVLTALSNIGSSRQKQILRIVGASIGGFVLGLGSQMFVLPYIDSIVGLTILFAFATGVSAYVAMSSPRLSYVGLQMAFAFYLINVTDFSISLDLTIGRDRAVGVLLGIGAMWLVFERLYTRSAGTEMVAGLARAARLMAGFTSALGNKNDPVESHRIDSVRLAASGLFTSINAEADAVPFENGNDRQSYLAARDRVRRWLSTLRTVYFFELTLVEARPNGAPELTSHERQEGDEGLYQALSGALEYVAKCLDDELEAVKCDHPDHETASDAQVASGRHRSLATLIRNDNISPSVRVLATMVNDLERDVSSEPVFAPWLPKPGTL
jgi:multidrug resistance protein MdtO